ncbi:MAG: zinc ribbon domain-containing protein [Chloroflexi bacterium]|nr:MAG: zinc ribbon domain-containing protein [Chloroflexota bacterium]
MAKKSLGYTELEWTCPNCDTRNPGAKKICLSCGSPQPDNVEFHQPAQETLITDEKKLAEAKAGPDVHCHYCGSRNSATAKTCSQCGADLSEGEKRKAGKVLGAHRDKAAPPITCPSCGAANAPDAPKCVQCGASLVSPRPAAAPGPAAPPPAPASSAKSKHKSHRRPTPQSKTSGGMSTTGKIVLVGLTLLMCAILAGVVMLLTRTSDVTATAAGVTWTRSIIIEQLQPVTRQGWRDEIPMGAVRGECTQKLRREQDQPAANAVEVCGTPYTVDTGSGFGQVVQDCKYQVYDDFCQYTSQEWQRVNELTRQGDGGMALQWPALSLAENQREAGRSETFLCTFNTESGIKNYAGGPDMLEWCQPGSRWILKVNGLGGITDVQPAR